jgi:hypothetical protein
MHVVDRWKLYTSSNSKSFGHPTLLEYQPVKTSRDGLPILEGDRPLIAMKSMSC